MRLILLLLLCSCATGYHKHGFSGGYGESMVGTDMYEVYYASNGYTSDARTERFLKRRCAELTKEKGFTHYVVMKSNPYNATIKLLRDPPETILAYEADMVIKSTAD